MAVQRKGKKGRVVSKPLHYAQDYDICALVLQGGGALGSYQAGVYQGLAEAGIQPNWICGISIGALNTAIIAGNPPEKRVDQLRAFWSYICQQPWLPGLSDDFLHQAIPYWSPPVRDLYSSTEAMRSIMEGQQGFFLPRDPVNMIIPHASPDQVSCYDTTQLRETLLKFADFDRINDAREMRVSIGAVNVRTSDFVYFDNTDMQLLPEHFMASGALPPGLPAVEIDGEYYWDGGLISNTPLVQVLKEKQEKDTLVFQVDLWSAIGDLPHSLIDVNERSKEIQFASRSRMINELMESVQNFRRFFNELLDLIPEENQDNPWYRRAVEAAEAGRCNVVQLTYENACQGFCRYTRTYQFGRLSLYEHWGRGLEEMRQVLKRPEYLSMPSLEQAFVIHDIHGSHDEGKKKA